LVAASALALRKNPEGLRRPDMIREVDTIPDTIADLGDLAVLLIDAKDFYQAIVAFFRRFLQHVLPSGFVRIRHYGLYASANVNRRLMQARALLQLRKSDADSSTDIGDDKSNNDDCDKPDFVKRKMDAFGIDPTKCPVCGSRMLRLKSIPRQQPPIQTRSPP